MGLHGVSSGKDMIDEIDTVKLPDMSIEFYRVNIVLRYLIKTK